MMLCCRNDQLEIMIDVGSCWKQVNRKFEELENITRNRVNYVCSVINV